MHAATSTATIGHDMGHDTAHAHAHHDIATADGIEWEDDMAE